MRNIPKDTPKAITSTDTTEIERTCPRIIRRTRLTTRLPAAKKKGAASRTLSIEVLRQVPKGLGYLIRATYWNFSDQQWMNKESKAHGYEIGIIGAKIDAHQVRLIIQAYFSQSSEVGLQYISFASFCVNLSEEHFSRAHLQSLKQKSKFITQFMTCGIKVTIRYEKVIVSMKPLGTQTDQRSSIKQAKSSITPELRKMLMTIFRAMDTLSSRLVARYQKRLTEVSTRYRMVLIRPIVRERVGDMYSSMLGFPVLNFLNVKQSRPKTAPSAAATKITHTKRIKSLQMCFFLVRIA